MLKKIKKNFVFILIFLIGLGILSYPVISRLYYRIDANDQITEFEKEKDNIDKEELDRRLGLARAYNDSLNNVVTDDPYDKERIEKGRAEYARMLEIKEKMGHVEIPKINQDIPIYAGTSEEVLQKGVGHLEGTSLPIGGNNTHAVLTAHSGLPTATLFTDLRLMEVGDKFYVHNIFGTLAYQVDQIKTIEPSNFTDLLVEPGHDYVTLLTCTPIMINTHRLIVRGHRVPYVPEVDEALIKENKSSYIYRYLFYLSLLIILILLLLIRRQKKKNKKILLEKQISLGEKDEKDK